ncbi:hypothetical protein C8Q75DRAFT_362241 [Abortiporus biennis]|nr:hypothetical protein C8Q75DRAFT_362241 [Abortiporus biennis]
MNIPNLPIPAPLLVLIHLHLLQYPLKDASGYDENIFNASTRGIGERTKALEDITFFLITKIEGQQAKKILPTYPCSAPSDTVALRTSLAKYLESLRNAVLRPTDKDANKDKAVAWWWKEVTVRKSLLEECAGDRFEKLLLALSMHALLASLPKEFTSDVIATEIPTDEDVAIRLKEYFETIAASQLSRASWLRSASHLEYRASLLKVLRAQLANPNSQQLLSSYYQIPTEKLLSLCDSRLHDIIKDHWNTDRGPCSLLLLKQLAGIGEPRDKINPPDDAVCENCPEAHTTSSNLSTPVLPLPVAAAHHPTHISALRKPIFDLPTVNENSAKDGGGGVASEAENGKHRPTIYVTERLEGEVAIEHALDNLNIQIAKRKAELEQRLKALRTSKSSINSNHKKILNISLPSVPQTRIIFHKEPTNRIPDESADFSLHAHEIKLQSRIAEIRGTLLPSYPPIPDETSLPSHDASIPSCIPQPSSSTSNNKISNAVAGPSHSTSTDAMQRKVKMEYHPLKKEDDSTQRRKSKKHVPRKSLAQGRARRSSVFRSRRKTVIFDEDIDKIADSVCNDSASFEFEGDVVTPQRNSKITKGTPLTPRSTIKKATVPRLSFDMEKHEKAIQNVVLPSLHVDSEDDWSVGGDAEVERDSQDEEFYEGNSMTLKDILLSADTTQFDLLGQDDDFADDSFDGWT